MRSALTAVVLAIAWPAAAAAQTTGPTGPTGPANPLPPTATTGSALDVSETAATVRAQVSANGAATTVRFQYGTSTGYGLTTATQTLPAGARSVEVVVRLERLTAATTYFFRVLGTNAAGVTPGARRSLRTASPPSRPDPDTDAAREVTRDAAILRGRVDPNRQPTSYAFEYGTSTRYGTTTPAADAGAGDVDVPVEAQISGLRADTTYHFRLRANNATGTDTGADGIFRTGKLPLAIAATASPSIVRYTGAVVVTGLVTGSDSRGLPVTLERRNFPYTSDFRVYGTPQLTDGAGRVSFVLPPFTLSSEFRLTARDAVSNVTTSRVRALVRLRVQRLDRLRVRMIGTISPGTAIGQVSIQRLTTAGAFAPIRRLTPTGRLNRFSATILNPARATTYRAVTLLTPGAVLDGRSSRVRVRGRR